MSKTVLFLVNHDVVIYNFRKELVERLLSDGFKVVISSPYGERIDLLVDLGCEYIETKIERHGTNPFKDYKLIQTYKKIIKKNAPDIVLTYTIKPNIYGGIAAKSCGVPYIANITGLGSAVENGGLLQYITLMLYKNAFSKINCVFFQNQENFDFFTSKVNLNGKGEIISGSGVNLNEFTPLSYPKDDSEINFLFISRVMKEKGIEQYIAAAKYIRNEYPHTKFHILGFCEEAYETQLNQLQSQGVLIYHGMQKDVKKFHAISHCTIHPTYYPEGMSNVLLESAACARPIITTDRSGCRETVDDGKTGFIVKVKDSDDLIKKIEIFLKLAQSEKEQMGLNGRKKMETEFDRQIVVDEYLKLIGSVCYGKK